jgi:hypothetical protein
MATDANSKYQSRREASKKPPVPMLSRRNTSQFKSTGNLMVPSHNRDGSITALSESGTSIEDKKKKLELKISIIKQASKSKKQVIML